MDTVHGSDEQVYADMWIHCSLLSWKLLIYCTRDVFCHCSQYNLQETMIGTLEWRHDERDGVSNHQPHGCLHNHLFSRKSKKKSRLRVIVRRAGLLLSQQDFEWRWSVPLFQCLTVLEFSFILFDLCLLITFFNFIMNYVPIVTFWIFTYHKIWILSIMFCFIWSYWIIYFLACL